MFKTSTDLEQTICIIRESSSIFRKISKTQKVYQLYKRDIPKVCSFGTNFFVHDKRYFLHHQKNLKSARNTFNHEKIVPNSHIKIDISLH